MADLANSRHGRAPARGSGGRRRGLMGNFPPCNALKNHKTGKESRYCANPLCSRPKVALHLGRRGAQFALTIRAFSTPLDRHPSIAATARRKLSPSQSLENSQNGKIIAIARKPIPQAGGAVVQFPRRHRRQPAHYLRPRWMASPSARKRETQLQSIRPCSLYGANSSCARSSPLSRCMPIDGNLSP